MILLKGLAVSSGIALGKLSLLTSDINICRNNVVSDITAELSRVDEAIKISKLQLTNLYEKASRNTDKATADIFKIHHMMLEDDDFLDIIHKTITSQAACSEYAIYTACTYFSGLFSKMEDEYMKARAIDVRDICDRVLNVLHGTFNDKFESLREPVVFAAEEFTPSQTIQADKKMILAFVSQKGCWSSHASILARNLGIPAVAGLGDNFAELKDGDCVIVDGTSGLVISNPDSKTLAHYHKAMEDMDKDDKRLKELINVPAETKDGAAIELCANIGNPDEAKIALEKGAHGIGLFRSEFLFLENDDFPSEEQQFQAYKRVLEIMKPYRVVIRTLDLGADKHASYFKLPHEENPAMGYRAIRVCLDRTDIFTPQLRALLRASVYGRLAVMFPMITQLEEIKNIFKLINGIKKDLKEENIPYSEEIEYGIMIETPAAVMMADQFAEEVDFFSIGTNDLTQYTFAVDRMNAKVSYLFDCGSPAILRMIQRTVNAAHAKGIWVGICGESAGDISLLPYYISVGIDELSMSAPQILKVKDSLRNLYKAQCIDECKQVLT